MRSDHKLDVPASSDWCVKVDTSNDTDGFVYANLPENKEVHTGFNGSQIWLAMFDENCLKESNTGFHLADSCHSETLLY